jgi:peptide/nickel transport system permease protein
MKRYLAQRLLHAVVLLFLISVVCFGLFELAPGNYLDAIRLDPRISPATVTMLRIRYGLDHSAVWRYVAWLRSVFRGEFGFSLGYGMPVGRLAWPRLLNTLLLTGCTLVLSWPLAFVIGAAGAIARRRNVSRLISGSMSLLISLPEVLVALAVLLVALRTRILPIPAPASVSPTEGAAATLSNLAVPVAALLLVSLPVLVRHVEAAFREAFNLPSTQAARALGIPPRRILFAYAFPAALNPLISLFGLAIGTLLSGSLVVEVVTGWPGLGPLVLEAVLSRDTPIVLAATLLSGSLFVAGNTVADLLLYAVDPRIRSTQ